MAIGKRDTMDLVSKQARTTRLYYKKLFQATILLSIVPTIVLAILVIFERLTILEGMSGVVAVILGSTFFARPYMEDLSALTNYVENLSLDKHSSPPNLSMLGSVEELSSAVQNLHNSWEEKKIRLEAALAESSILFDTIPDILMMLGQDMRIIRANTAAKVLFGNKIENIGFDNIVKEPALKELIKSVMDNKKSESIELSITNYNVKRDFQINIERFPLYSIGGIAVVLIMHDVTAAKRTRQMLKDFVANASHEIRTPLTSIVGFIENLQDMQEDKETRKKFLDIMTEQSERMVTLVNDLLSLSKVEMNESSVPTEKISIPPIVQTAIQRLEHLANNKEMVIIYKCNSNIPDVLGDKNELLQVFINLISNAIKYGYEKTEIIISISLTDNILASDNHIFKNARTLLSVSIEDKGEGIPEELLSRITERFYRVDKTRSRNIGGTGLGLSIVKHILNRHRAEMTIKSTENIGSVFTVLFPVQE